MKAESSANPAAPYSGALTKATPAMPPSHARPGAMTSSSAPSRTVTSAASSGISARAKPAPAFAPLIAVPDRPAIIVNGLRHDNGELGAFLDLIKMGGASIPVRSMVTPTSKGWTLANLLLELNTEHETMQGGNA